jgi:hypothetical protein
MSFVPSFTLLASNGTTVVYSFEYIQRITGWPSDAPSNIEITNLRSQGSINIPGGNRSADLTLNGILIGTDYTDLQGKISTLQSTIAANTNYILELEKSSSTSDKIRVQRITPIQWEDSQRTTTQKYSIMFRTLSW